MRKEKFEIINNLYIVKNIKYHNYIMQIIIKNIWKIKEAKVNLNWLTIIAWNNDSWKSTVSKIVFSVIKALQRYKEDFDYTKEKLLEKEIEMLYFHLRSIVLHSKSWNNEIRLNELLKKEFYPPIFMNELTAFWWIDLFVNKKNLIQNLWLWQDDEKTLFHKIDKVKELFLKDEKREDLIKRALESIIESEFENELSNIKLWKVGTITLMEWMIILFQIDIENNKISNVKIYDDILRIKDTTFIDTPITINLFNYLINTINYRWIRRNKEIQFHIKDLFSKIWNSKFEKERQNWFWKKVKDLVGWTFEIIQKGSLWDQLTFTQNWKNIDPINTATWIKSFWILDLLDRSHCLDDSNLLILDEPEVHLHPEWQVKYAELIVWLVKERWLTVLITSHSPYLIEWLNKFSKDNNIRDKFNLYLTKEETWYDIIEDKTDNAGEVFERLSAPFEKLVWW